MAVPPLPKPKLGKLQALLLLGGAFVLAGVVWALSHDRLVSEPDWDVFGDDAAMITVYGDSPSARRFIDRLTASSSDTFDVSALNPRSAAVFYVKADEPGGALNVRSAEVFQGLKGSHPRRLRLVSKDTQAVGYIALDGKKEPFSAAFESDKAIFRIGRDYRGIFGGGPASSSDPRMITSSSDQLFYAEKPEAVSWNGVPALLSSEMQRFPVLSTFWSLPGRVELTVSASGTGTALQPFSLYYRPAERFRLPQEAFETLAIDLLADAMPQPVDTKLPDGSHMQELRRDRSSIRSSVRPNQFGVVKNFTVSGQSASLSVFFMKDKEVWLTTDLMQLQQIYLGKIGTAPANDACHTEGSGGFAVIPGSFLPGPAIFNKMTISIHNSETGLSIICGYY